MGPSAARTSQLSAPERRRSRREARAIEVFLSSPTGGRKLEALILDISRHGVRLSLKQAVAAGTYHLLEMPASEGRKRSEVHILSCRRESDGSHHVHAQFC